MCMYVFKREKMRGRKRARERERENAPFSVTFMPGMKTQKS